MRFSSSKLRFPPEPNGVRYWINAFVGPPAFLVADAMQRPMMNRAKGYSPLVADFPRHGLRLRKTQVVGVGLYASDRLLYRAAP